MSTATRLVNFSKTFNGVCVLDQVSFDLRPGEIHGLVGENGSGKSTLVKLLSGTYTPDRGAELHIDGAAVTFHSPQHLDSIATIHQEKALVDDMTVMENVGLSAGYGTRSLGVFRKKRETAIVQDLMDGFGVRLNPSAKVSSLAPSEKSIVAILRALRQLRESGAIGHIVILDEPTAALKAEEAARLLSAVKSLAKAGASILFISHRLSEVLEVCDRVTVLRSGRHIATVDIADTTSDDLVTLMLGYELGAFYPVRDETTVADDVVLRVEALTGRIVEDLSFSIRAGEVLGVTGLTGMGQDELPYLIYGHLARSGRVVCDGAEITADIGASLRGRMVLVPGDRLRDAIWLRGTAMENLTLPHLRQFRWHGLLNRRSERQFTLTSLRDFNVRPQKPFQAIGTFSGGNQQKVVLARWLTSDPRVLLLHEPTQGVDAGARKEIFELVRAAAERGAAALICSSDTEEVANVCNRVLVLRDGAIAAEVDTKDLSVDRLSGLSQGPSTRVKEQVS